MPENRVMFPKPVVLGMRVTALETIRREQVYVHFSGANAGFRTLYHGFSQGSEPDMMGVISTTGEIDERA
jgi:hypothetical protein